MRQGVDPGGDAGRVTAVPLDVSLTMLSLRLSLTGGGYAVVPRALRGQGDTRDRVRILGGFAAGADTMVIAVTAPGGAPFRARAPARAPAHDAGSQAPRSRGIGEVTAQKRLEGDFVDCARRAIGPAAAQSSRAITCLICV